MENPKLTIGVKAPHFQADTTYGPVHFPEDYKGKWVVFFSHPGSFTPVCTTEMMTFASMQPDFDRHDCALLGLSVDSRASDIAWKRAMESYHWKHIDRPQIGFPIIADTLGAVARQYGMLANETDTRTVRSVFVVDPDGIIRAILYYPATTGRNLNEILRLVAALQASDATGNLTPANWMPGEEMLVPMPATAEDAAHRAEKPDGASCLDWYLCFTGGMQANAAAPLLQERAQRDKAAVAVPKPTALNIPQQSAPVPAANAAPANPPSFVPENMLLHVPTPTANAAVTPALKTAVPPANFSSNPPSKPAGFNPNPLAEFMKPIPAVPGVHVITRAEAEKENRFNAPGYAGTPQKAVKKSEPAAQMPGMMPNAMPAPAAQMPDMMPNAMPAPAAQMPGMMPNAMPAPAAQMLNMMPNAVPMPNVPLSGNPEPMPRIATNPAVSAMPSPMQPYPPMRPMQPMFPYPPMRPAQPMRPAPQMIQQPPVPEMCIGLAVIPAPQRSEKVPGNAPVHPQPKSPAAGQAKAEIDKVLPGKALPDKPSTGKMLQKGEKTPRGIPHVFDAGELARYNGKNGMPPYAAVNGVVYDLSAAWRKPSRSGLTAGTDITRSITRSSAGMASLLNGLPVVGLYSSAAGTASLAPEPQGNTPNNEYRILRDYPVRK